MKVKWLLLTCGLIAVLVLGACGGSDDKAENKSESGDCHAGAHDGSCRHRYRSCHD